MDTIFAGWIQWLSSMRSEEILWLHLPALLLDGPRYVLGALGVCLYDLGRAAASACGFSSGRGLSTGARRSSRNSAGAMSAQYVGAESGLAEQYAYAPSVAVVLAGLNEGDTVVATLSTLVGSYPRLEILVVDDGSTDGMADKAREFAQTHPEVKVFRRQLRGGKSSALNLALNVSQAEIVVNVDADSVLGPHAIWEIVQPFADSRVSAAGGTVMVRNAATNLCTWIQALEYRRGIFLGRLFTSRLDLLGIVSGAFGAFRASTMKQLRGWDVGPGEDGDLVLRMRRAGHRVVHVSSAECYTNAPTRWWPLFRQRRRWEWAIVTFECRKHLAMAWPFQAKFRWTNLLLVLDRIVFNVVLVYTFWIFALVMLWQQPPHAPWIFFSNYLVYLLFELIQTAITVYYSPYPIYDLKLACAAPLMPFYYVVQRAVTCWAITEEFWTRRSFRDNFVPARVREKTWHW